MNIDDMLDLPEAAFESALEEAAPEQGLAWVNLMRTLRNAQKGKKKDERQGVSRTNEDVSKKGA